MALPQPHHGPRGQRRPALPPWDPDLAKETLKAPMPSRTDPKNAAILHNIDQHPALATMPPGPHKQFFIRARASTQLVPGPHMNQLFDTDYDGSFDEFSEGSQPITKCAMPVKHLGGEGQDAIHKPNFAKIQNACKTMKHWTQLGLNGSLEGAIENMGNKRPLPMEKVVITAVQEGVSAFVCGSSGCAKTTAALIASMNVVMKNLGLMPLSHETPTYEGCAPVVLMVVPSHDLAEAAYADVVNFMTKSDVGLENKINIVAVHGGIDRYKNMDLLHECRLTANIIVGTPGRLVDMMERNLISSDHLRLIVLDQAFTLAGGSFLDDMDYMDYIKRWAKGPSAAPGEKTWSNYTAPTSATTTGPHRGTNVVTLPTPADFKPEPVNPRLRAQIPCIILSQVLDLRSPRDVALRNYYRDKFALTRHLMVVCYNTNPLQNLKGSVPRQLTPEQLDKLIDERLARN